MKEITAVKVVARARPLLTDEIINEEISCVETVLEEGQIIVANEKSFSFDHILNETATQDDVYKTCVSEIVNKVLTGYNATVLAYGQTGTGKTYTMGTDYSSCSKKSPSETGIVPRVLNDLFDTTQDTPDAEYSIKVSFLEIYNKSIYDLLTKEKKQVQIQEQATGVKVPGLRMINVKNVSEALHWLQEGCITRTTAATSMNLNSSRSHAIFTIYVHRVDEQEQISKLHLVDLAGSETVHNNEADRFKEGVSINLGLLALERVISALCKGNQNTSSHIPYRSSPLTHLLKDCLNEGSYTVMIVCISPAHSSMVETINTLRYAARARCIKCKPVKNKFAHLENSIVKRKFRNVPRTPFTPCPSNQEFNLTMTTPSYLPPEKKQLISTIAIPYERKDRELNSIPPPLRFSPSPNTKQRKLCTLTEIEESTNDVSLPAFLLSPTVAEETKLNAAFQPDISVMISPVVRQVCSQFDKTLGKKLENLEKRLLEQMEENAGIVFKQSNHTLLLTPLQTTMIGKLKRKIGESASKYLHNEASSFTPLHNRTHTSFSLMPQAHKNPNRPIFEIAEDISPCATPETARQKSPTLHVSLKNSPLVRSIEFGENVNTMKPPISKENRVLREKNQNSPNEKRKKTLRRRTTMGIFPTSKINTRGRKSAASYDTFKDMFAVNTKLQKKRNKEILKFLNTSTIKALQTLPLVGPKTAQIIFTWREFRGLFESLSDIKNIQGLPRTFFQRFSKANFITED